MRAALDLAAPRLRRCAGLGDGNLFIELKVDADGTAFASATPLYESDPELLRCVRRVVSSLRFAPTPRQVLVEEYHP